MFHEGGSYICERNIKLLEGDYEISFVSFTGYTVMRGLESLKNYFGDSIFI